ncbi:hypothetical protein AR540_03890 [Pseudomonas sp. EpS/L25]|nr:hypothetical protein AR540_03890 [Pseudomonas sp. EpS/L25]
MLTPNQIKSLLRAWIARTHPVADRDVFIDELCFVDKTRRADLVLANGKLSAFEIKSCADTLARWAGQQLAYLSCFDEVWLCCHSRHLARAIDESDSKVGIIVVDDFSGMAVIRLPKKNTAVDPYHLTGFLWREQLEQLALESGVSLSRKVLVKDLRRSLSKLPIEILKGRVLEVLKDRYVTI